MSEDLALLAAIDANEMDDLPRLVYADWLEEQGDPLAELIRVQCELEALQEREAAPNALGWMNGEEAVAEALDAREDERLKGREARPPRPGLPGDGLDSRAELIFTPVEETRP